ncbi:MAG: hypothetical protein ACMVY4_05565 [Minwuia sp.]|uniref:hypothetical protein n=1 Tax=Minwuia sp. TaxID=2493630 RepID=UPI003A8832E4
MRQETSQQLLRALQTVVVGGNDVARSYTRVPHRAGEMSQISSTAFASLDVFGKGQDHCIDDIVDGWRPADRLGQFQDFDAAGVDCHQAAFENCCT